MFTVFLCGFMGCGKTTVGKELALMLGTSFVDTDEYIVNKTGKTIPEIFAERGEDCFRRLETEAVKELAGKGGVVACGGGTMLNNENAETANSDGAVVLIEMTFEDCYNRIKDDKNRPLVAKNTKQQLNLIYDTRLPIYRDNAYMCVHGYDTPVNVADGIAHALHLGKYKVIRNGVYLQYVDKGTI